GSRNNTVVGNTIVNTSGYFAVQITGGSQSSSGNKVFDNVLWRQVTSSYGSIGIDSGSLSGFQSDYNVVVDRFNLDPLVSDQPITLAQWRTQTGQDLHSIVATPDQLFANWANGDFRLKAGSPAIDAGTDLASLTTDTIGGARPAGVRTDIGAYEYGATVNGVPPDLIPPTATVTAPANGATVIGMIQLTADATDNVGVAGVQFYVDGNPVGAEDTTSPYSINWESSTVGNGSHTITAQARDTAGNTAMSAPVTVTTTNPTTPLLAFSFNQGSGTTVTSTGSSALTGTISGATWVSGGRYGSALSFNGTNAVVSVPDAPSLHLLTGMTLEAWVKPTTVDAVWRDVIYKA